MFLFQSTGRGVHRSVFLLHSTLLVVIVHLDVWSPFGGVDVEIATTVPVERGVVVVVSRFSIAGSVRAVNVGGTVSSGVRGGVSPRRANVPSI